MQKFGDKKPMSERYPSSKKVVQEKQEAHALKEAKGSDFFEEAMRREQEYQERIKIGPSTRSRGITDECTKRVSFCESRQMQPSVGSLSLPGSSQELCRKPRSLVGLKRKEVSPSCPQQALQGCRNPQLLLKALTQGERSHQPSPPQAQYSKPPLSTKTKPSPQVPKEAHPSTQTKPSPWIKTKPSPQLPSPKEEQPQEEFERQLHVDVPTQYGQLHVDVPTQYNRQVSPGSVNDHQRASSGQMTSQWCDLCNVPCMNELNLQQHIAGRRHRAKWEKRSGEQAAVCRECNVTCPDELALAMHRAGKNHALRLIKLGVVKVPETLKDTGRSR